jgi:hypothetical protein
MNKKLLFFSVLLTSVFFSHAQIKVWDFAAQSLGAGFTDRITVANQTSCALFNAGSAVYSSGNTSTPTITASATFGEVLINTLAGDRWRSDNTALVLYDTQLNNNNVTPVFVGATNSGRLAFNGTGNATRRYYSITLTAGQTVTIYWKSNLIASGNLTVTPPSGSTVATALAYPAVTNTYDFRETKLTADIAGVYTIGDYIGKMETYRIYLANVTAAITSLGNDNFNSITSLDIFSIKNQLYVKNINSDTVISVYNLTGALVKTISTSKDIDFQMETNGFYVVNVANADGQKSVKVSVNN